MNDDKYYLFLEYIGGAKHPFRRFQPMISEHSELQIF
jgi:hypothetical protein